MQSQGCYFIQLPITVDKRHASKGGTPKIFPMDMAALAGMRVGERKRENECGRQTPNPSM